MSENTDKLNGLYDDMQREARKQDSGSCSVHRQVRGEQHYVIGPLDGRTEWPVDTFVPKKPRKGFRCKKGVQYDFDNPNPFNR